MVRCDNDDGIGSPLRGGEFRQKRRELGIGVGHAGVVAVHNELEVLLAEAALPHLRRGEVVVLLAIADAGSAVLVKSFRPIGHAAVRAVHVVEMQPEEKGLIALLADEVEPVAYDRAGVASTFPTPLEALAKVLF